jgi:hypothetical protein
MDSIVNGRPKCWAVLLLLFWFCDAAYAQAPESFRLDLSAGYFQRPMAVGFLQHATFPTLAFVGPTNILLFDVTATANFTEDLNVSAGLPFGMVFNASSREGDEGFGIGNVHAAVSYGLLSERPWLPGLRARIEGGAPTASFDVLGTRLWRATPGLTFSKSVTPRFSLFIDGSYTHLFDRGSLHAGPIYSAGGGVDLGVTETVVLTLFAQNIIGGKLEKDDRTAVAARHNVNAGLVFTQYSRGRPRFSVGFFAGELQEGPSFGVTFKWAVLSF